MNEFEVSVTEETLAYLRQIAAAMTIELGVGEAEAVGRIRKFWRGQEFTSDSARTALLHRTAESWAKQIYYGGQMWWLDGPPPEPEPYNPEQ